ncbi:hypothetical protein E2C01_070818 [Portunus trituberculatus]|uniref:Uncharacterized protein n=1 Tax=Portunus trituberculatus TaxID=210409 RepID=A0A5B7I6C0_PORTR|nr:hypothetical protein [Portunus trituberculatus]
MAVLALVAVDGGLLHLSDKARLETSVASPSISRKHESPPSLFETDLS